MIIWVAGRNVPLPENGMMGSFEMEQARLLAGKGNQVIYLTCVLHPVKTVRGRGFQSWEEGGITVLSLSAFFAPRIYPFYFPKQRNRLWGKLFGEAEKRFGTPDVIHVHYPAMLMIADALRPYHERGVRTVFTEHWSKVLAHQLDPAEKKEYRKYREVTDLALAVSSALKKAVDEQTGLHAEVVENPVSPYFRPSEDKHEGFRFTAVGRLTAVKQFDRLILTFDEAFHGQKDVSLTIVGGGEERDSLERLIREKGISGQVFLTGRKDREETAAIVKGCDCLVCSSKYETFGVPIIEAWAAGIPTVSTVTASVVNDHADPGLGLRIDPEKPDALKNAMVFMTEHRDEFDSDFISAYARTHFSEEVIAEKLLKAYSLS